MYHTVHTKGFMALNIDMKNIPPYLRIIITIIPSLILVILFVVFIYSPKSREIKLLSESIVRLGNEITSSEVKASRLSALKIEDTRLKARLVELQEQLPEEKEVSGLLKQISGLGIKSGLKILLWRPESKIPDPSELYVNIPVKIEVLTGYHNLGTFFSHISRLPRIVNISEIKLSNPQVKKGVQLVNASFTATTFSAVGTAESHGEKIRP
ncbi:MAG: type 4a pilus biogenesis protein PilO [Nitrospirae bacterium]|nr:type 4a pilus biogenesis protein PilO [Nitrospirota bacterium]